MMQFTLKLNVECLRLNAKDHFKNKSERMVNSKSYYFKKLSLVQ